MRPPDEHSQHVATRFVRRQDTVREQKHHRPHVISNRPLGELDLPKDGGARGNGGNVPRGPLGPSRLELDKPVIAAVAGPAVAGGMELALWCDFRVMEHSAYLGVYCRRWGVPLIDGGTVRLPRIVGVGRAREVILFGRTLTAEEALDWGLVNRVAAQGEAYADALALAREFAAEVDPGAAALAKRLITYGWAAPTATGRYMEYLADISQLASDALQTAADNFSGKSKGD